jgi:CTD kinase subunit gamma
MSFDPFEARLQFLGLLRNLNASQQSIQKVVSYALKYGRKCGEDLWDCIVEECGKVRMESLRSKTFSFTANNSLSIHRAP